MEKPITTYGRREDYVRLPFVDDLCLHSAMQGFLRRKPSSKAKLTKRQTKSSWCQRCHARVSSPAISVTSEKLSKTCEVFTWMPFRGTHVKVWWAYTLVSPNYSSKHLMWLLRWLNWLFLKTDKLVRPAPTKNLRRRLVSKTSYAYDL